MHSAPDWPDWTDFPTVILGAGPSLTPDVLWTIQQAREQCKIRVIAINATFRMAPWADHLHAADWQFWDAYQDAVDFPGMLTTCSEHRRHAEVTYAHGSNRQGLSEDPAYLHHGSHSGYQAIGIAYHCQSPKAILVGYDYRAISGKRHAHPPHPRPCSDQPPFKHFAEMMATIWTPPPHRAFRLVNCTPDSALNGTIPNGLLEDELP